MFFCISNVSRNRIYIYTEQIWNKFVLTFVKLIDFFFFTSNCNVFHDLTPPLAYIDLLAFISSDMWCSGRNIIFNTSEWFCILCNCLQNTSIWTLPAINHSYNYQVKKALLRQVTDFWQLEFLYQFLSRGTYKINFLIYKQSLRNTHTVQTQYIYISIRWLLMSQ